MDVILVNESGVNVGKVTIEEAQHQAELVGKDLVMVNEENRVYKIADAGKLRYEQKQRDREKRSKQKAQKRTHKVKEIRLSPGIGDHDLEVKVRHIRDFLSKGLKTKVTMRFKGRHRRNLDIFQAAGRGRIEEVVDLMLSEDIAKVDGGIKCEGLNLSVFLVPSHK